ncbi:MAG: thioredoxin domain-containing protein [Myxococcota bacterium]
MPARLLQPSTLVVSFSLLTLAAACRPSKAEMAAMQATLTDIRAEQEKLGQRLDAMAQRDDQQSAELGIIEEGLIDVAKRMNAVEGTLAEQEEKARKVADRPRPGRPDPAAVYRVKVGDSPVLGNPNALVTIVMWTDYQCPYCARVQTTLEMMRKEYGKNLRLVHKNNPLGFHPRAMPAAIAAHAAGRQGKFWEMNDKLFANNKELTDDDILKYAKKLKLKMRRFKADLEDPAIRKAVLHDQTEGVAIGARGTPAFFINGRFLSGAQPPENFRKLIDEELAKAKALVAEGTPRSKVYQVTIADGRTKV